MHGNFFEQQQCVKDADNIKKYYIILMYHGLRVRYHQKEKIGERDRDRHKKRFRKRCAGNMSLQAVNVKAK